MRQLVTGFVIVLGALLGGCGGGGAAASDGTTPAADGNAAPANNQTAPAGDSVYQIVNNSTYDIHYIYISPTSQSTWGPDQLGPSDILHSNQSLTLRGVACDQYDMKLVDEDGDECIQQAVEICHNTVLTITNDDLLRCEGYQ